MISLAWGVFMSNMRTSASGSGINNGLLLGLSGSGLASGQSHAFIPSSPIKVDSARSDKRAANAETSWSRVVLPGYPRQCEADKVFVASCPSATPAVFLQEPSTRSNAKVSSLLLSHSQKPQGYFSVEYATGHHSVVDSLGIDTPYLKPAVKTLNDRSMSAGFQTSTATDNGDTETPSSAQATITPAEQEPRFQLPRIHAGRGKCQLFGQFVHIEFIYLALLEFVLAALVVDLCLSAGVGPSLIFGSVFNGVGLLGLTVFALIISAVSLSLGLYDSHQRGCWQSSFGHMFVASLLSITIIAAMTLWLTDYGLLPELTRYWSSGIYTFIALFTVLLAALAAVRFIFYRYVDGHLLVRRVLVVGAGNRASKIAELRRQADKRGFHLLGFVDHGRQCDQGHGLYDRVVATPTGLCEYSLAQGVDEIVLAVDDRRVGLPTEELLDCRMSGISVIDDLDFLEREAGLIQLDVIQSSWLIHAEGFHRNYLRRWAKRGFDLVFSMLLAACLLPFALLTALAITIECRGRDPIIYCQKRVGERGRLFRLYKFRSMGCDAEAEHGAQWACCDDPRVTRVGAVIRKYRLDEIPQIWNVLIGDMSLVGPRPERPEFVKQLAEANAFYLERHRLAPGITGWAQLYYPYGASTFDAIEKLKYDLYYLKHQGLLLDLFVLMKTVEVVLFKRGAR